MRARAPVILIAIPIILLLIPIGCDELPSLPLKPTEPPDLAIGSAFDSATAGTIAGQVTWSGKAPDIKPYLAPLGTGTENQDRTPRYWANPHAPVVNSFNQGVGSAIVYLRGVEPRLARPWDQAPVRVEMRAGQFHVLQGGADSCFGFVRPGDEVEMVSRESWFEILQARGAAFFSLAFADPGLVRKRPLHRLGRVELISGAGHYWMRAHLFVIDHPYYTRTDSEGRFTLPRVPPGDYQLVCSHPSWHMADFERDVGTLLMTHLRFRLAVEVIQSIHVERSRTVNTRFTLSSGDFEE